MRGILKGLRDHHADGHMVTVQELIHGDIFGDFMEMAMELYGARYEHPAAVIAGSVLEEHMRKLAERHNLSVEDENGSHSRLTGSTLISSASRCTTATSRRPELRGLPSATAPPTASTRSTAAIRSDS